MKTLLVAIFVLLLAGGLFFAFNGKEDKHKAILEDYGKAHGVSFTFDMAKSGEKLDRIQKQFSPAVTYYLKATSPGILVNVVEFSDQNIAESNMKRAKSTKSNWYLGEGRYLFELIGNDTAQKIALGAVLAPDSLLPVVSQIHNAGFTVNDIIIADSETTEKIAANLDAEVDSLYNAFVLMDDKICQVNLAAGEPNELLSSFSRLGTDVNNLIELPHGVIEVIANDNGLTAARIRDIVVQQ